MTGDPSMTRPVVQALVCAATGALWEQPDGPTEADCTLLDALAAWARAEHGEETPGGIEALASTALQAVREPRVRVLYQHGDGTETPALEVVVAR